ncbi:hypothetical protein U9M48_011598 [Paspalum notatum var. saurae]|uniref:Uncharacterized protein n=1 Tax=Paspalum notatum var. saurae TaxID=547442 RepID=A0AAQ3WHV5_PASNO
MAASLSLTIPCCCAFPSLSCHHHRAGSPRQLDSVGQNPSTSASTLSSVPKIPRRLSFLSRGSLGASATRLQSMLP